MDTISRENNSMLPVGGVIVGVLALLVGGYGAIKASGLQKKVDDMGPKVEKIAELESQIATVAGTADKSKNDIATLSRSTQDAVTQLSNLLGDVSAKIVKMEESAKKPAAVGKGAHGPVVAGPGEYVIKAGDTFAKIGRANGGFSGADVASVNPGVDPSKLKIGQKIKLPQKK